MSNQDMKQFDIEDLLNKLSPAEKHAVILIKTALDTYNSYEGTGLFTGVERYTILEGRIRIAAAQSRSLFEFWATLMRKLIWPAPSKEHSAKIMASMVYPEKDEVLRILIDETAAVVMLARALHDKGKSVISKQTGYDDECPF